MTRIAHSGIAVVLASASAALLAGACGDEPAGGGEITFFEQTELFPNFSFDSGLAPAGSPVQASFALGAEGTAAARAVAVASGSTSAPTLSGLPQRGTIEIAGAFSMVGNLVVALAGLPNYDGPIPGLDNVEIRFTNNAIFDPFLIGGTATARADIPPTRLPDIPLPAGLPGAVVLEIAEGSFVEVELSGTEACVAGNEARYRVSLDRGGRLVIHPSIEIEVPAVGTQSFPIPAFQVPFNLGSSSLSMSAPIVEIGERPAQGDHVNVVCDGAGQGGAGGAPPGPGSCVGAEDCGGLPCVEGTCSAGGGVCDTGGSFDDEQWENCVNDCCAEYAACTNDYSDFAACAECVADGSGPSCDAFIECMAPCGAPVCNSGLWYGEAAVAACLAAMCCEELNVCTYDGSDVEGCIECFEAGGGPRCDAALACTADCAGATKEICGNGVDDDQDGEVDEQPCCNPGAPCVSQLDCCGSLSCSGGVCG